MAEALDQTLAVLNGLVGDYLARTDNGLATEMACHHDGRPLPMTREALARAHPDASPRAALFVHGVMCTESIWRFPDGSDYGSKLRERLGITPLYLRYNSGLPIADNGAALAELLQALLDAYPRELQEIVLVGYSMGGLLVRSACHVAHARGLPWLARVQRAIYVGTPHLGAPAERLGRLTAKLLRVIPDPYTRLVAEVADLRSAGVKDLGDADLRHEDRASAHGRLSLRDPRHPVPLLPNIRHSLVAGSLGQDPVLAQLFGDAIVPVRSATARGEPPEGGIAPERVAVLRGRSHVDLAHDAQVYEVIEEHCR